jgi:hypothetical protein
VTGEDLTVGQEVRVHSPFGTRPGTVTFIGRKWVTITYGDRLKEFDIQTCRSKGLQVGIGTWFEVVDRDLDAERERYSAAVDALEAEGIRLDPDHELSLEQLESHGRHRPRRH